MIFFTRKHYIRKLFVGTIIVTILIGLFIIREYSQTPQISTTGALRSLLYLAWAPAEDTIEKKGVIKYDRTRSFKGINIYSSDPSYKYYLVDMHGNILHTWSITEDELQYARLCKNGDLLAISMEEKLVRLDWASNIKWIKNGLRFHHDIAVAGDENIYALTARKEWVFKSGLPFLIANDYIIILSPGGEIKRKISLFDVLKKDILLNRLIKIYLWMADFNNIKETVALIRKGYPFPTHPFDIIHANTIEIINRDIPGLCKKGDLLICACHLDLVGILDIEKERLTWSWGPGHLDKPHHPSLLENGNILIFDNGCTRGYSRIVEINPFTKDIVWEYKADPPKKFFSYARGGCKRLPNGNTLITESDNGRVFEITSDGEVVWEFYNPLIRKDKNERLGIYRMMRITDPENYPCLEGLQ